LGDFVELRVALSKDLTRLIWGLHLVEGVVDETEHRDEDGGRVGVQEILDVHQLEEEQVFVHFLPEEHQQNPGYGPQTRLTVTLDLWIEFVAFP
jgi:hypothetical protein